MGPPRGSWASGESGGTSRLNVDEVNGQCDLVAEREGEGDINKFKNFCYNVCINAQKALPLRKIINITTYETTTIAQIRTHDANLR